ncbi:hypothetical protein ACPOL_7178 (plasmid) [Acidisarcina polymorpha]|uniref:Uncharacterized protein n=1 Tax=Acidisarcina polymorpha TaxID=2211140 RepID=A0A2Z5GBI5_9BACT|nr:DUF2961 domain-containing protein [Acidisarcina polymorpha]AXC16368.1 hypothetical protein ACPOL_7178 [Acidisarcina polymorpha]
MDRRAFSLSLAGLSLTGVSASPYRAAALATTQEGTNFTGATTFTHVGKEEQPFLPHAEAELANQKGNGYLDHMWFGGDFPNYTRLRLRIYVDGEQAPSIDMELGLGVGVGFADPAAPWGTEYSGITGNPSGIFLNYRIPFSKSIRVTAELPAGVPRSTVFWWIIRGLENHHVEVGGFILPERARLRLHKIEDQEVQPLDEFDLCRVPEAGMVFQVTMAARSTSLEFMEGQMRAYIGGAREPQFLSSGLEDYFLGTYYFNRGLYHLPQAGLTHRDEKDSSFSGYRFHVIDPILFSGGLRLACRCGEKRSDKVFGPYGKPFKTTYTTYTWTYEW